MESWSLLLNNITNSFAYGAVPALSCAGSSSPEWSRDFTRAGRVVPVWLVALGVMFPLVADNAPRTGRPPSAGHTVYDANWSSDDGWGNGGYLQFWSVLGSGYSHAAMLINSLRATYSGTGRLR